MFSPGHSIEKHGVLPIHIGGLLLCASVLVCGWFLGLGPMLRESYQTSTLAAEADDAERELQVSREALDRKSDELDATIKELDLQPVNLESSVQINSLLSDLASWSDDNQLIVTRTHADRPVAMAYYDYVPIRIAGEGTYANILKFLAEIQHGRGDLQLVTFSVSRMTREAMLSFEFDLAWYVLNDTTQSSSQPPTAAVEIR